ncbi:MAG TPA: hypothetical protein DHV62_07660, partial [Elusimicrobia bacterium]|nr:hypothetical protein [Elusimicrobiota bacterium]
MKKIFLTLLLLIFTSTNLLAKIYLTKIPIKLVKTDGSVEEVIEWLTIYNPITRSSEPANCQLRYRLSPGTLPTDYNLGYIDQTTKGKLTFNSTNQPSKHGISAGVLYCRIFEKDSNSNYSDEFVLYVESIYAPTLTEPKNAARVDSPRPTFKWNKVSGVPYYIIMVFDRPITIKKEKNEKGEEEWKVTTPDGAPIRPVWQAITPENSFVYGTPDPSGTFTEVYQPLLGGTTYNWLVTNCYANNPAFIGSVIPTIWSFSYAQKPNIPIPVPLKPGLPQATSPYQEITDESITFEWSVSTAPEHDRIANYHLYVYMKKESDTGGLSLSILAWDASTSNTYFDVDAKSVFTESIYDWYVTAEDAKGLSVQSQTFAFKYKKALGYLDIEAKYYDEVTKSSQPVAKADVKLEATNDGSTNPYPLFTGDSGTLGDIELRPGTYKITITKTGFESASATAMVSSTHTKDTSALAKIYLPKSPSFIVGKVIDSESKSGISGAKVKAVQREAPYTEKSADTDSSGGFKFSVWDNTSWNISVSKVGYSVVTTSVSVGSNETKNITLTATRNKNIITGTVKNENGFPVLVATVKIKSESAEWSILTDQTGNFSFTVADGIWILTATKLGFVSPTPLSLTVTGGQTVKKDLVLTSQANRVTGYVTDNQRNIPDVTVKALTPAGSVVASDITNTYGQYTLNLKGGQTYEIIASKTGYTLSASQQVTFSADASGQTNSGINLVLIPNRSYVEGKVTSDGGVGLADATVTDGVSTVKTRADGTYQLSMNEGTYQIKATKEGYTSPPAQTLTIGVGVTISSVNFVLNPNASVIKGNVSSTEGAVYGATVNLSTGPSASLRLSTLTDEFGAYTFSLEAGTWYLEAKKSGFVGTGLSTATVKVAPGQTSTGNNLRIIPNIGYISGVVKDESQTPVRSVSVRVTNRSGKLVGSSTTGNDGKFTFTLEPDTYTFTVERLGYTPDPLSQNFSVLLDQKLELLKSFVMKKNNYFLSGEVFGPGSIRLKDVTIIVEGSSRTLTDINGRYKIGLDTGTYNVTVNKTGYKILTSTTVTFELSDPTGITKTRNFQMDYNYAAISGTITTNGTALSGATVSIPGKTATTDTNGNFSFPNLLPGDYRLMASKSGYLETSLPISSLSPGEIRTISLSLAQAAFSIQGMVIDTTTAIGIPASTVRIQHTEKGFEKYTVTSSTGWYYFSNLSTGPYSIEISKADYDILAGSETFILTTDISNFDFLFVPLTAKIEVEILDDEQRPVTNAAVIAESGEGYFGQGISASNGKLTISNLNPTETYTVKAKKKGYELEISTGTDISPGSSRTIVLKRILGSLSGYVKKEGLGEKEVAIKITSLGGVTFSTTTLTDGSYSLINLLPDTYLISVSKIDHYSEPLEQEIEITEDKRNVSVSTFTLVYSPVKELALVLPAKIVSQPGVVAKHNFSLLAKDADGRSIPSGKPEWSVEDVAGEIDENGIFTPKPDFFGKTLVKAKIGDKIIEKEFDLWFKVVESTNDIELQNTDRMKLRIPAGITVSSTTSEDEITVSAELPSGAKKTSVGYQVVGKGFHLQPDEFKFSDLVTVSLPIP